MKRSASAVWTGDLKSGSGTISSQSGVLEKAQYSFKTRFEDGKGTNPEELIGAAHAGCFSMAFANELASAGHPAEKIETTAEVTLEMNPDGPSITAVHLKTTARVPGTDEAEVRRIGEAAKQGCPVSKVLNADITLDLTVQG